MLKYLRIYRLRLKLSLKILANSLSNFYIGILGFLIIQITGIIFINITFKKIPNIAGYSYYQVIALYGFSQISKGLDHFYSDYLWFLSNRCIVRGEYDKFMIRPVNTYFQVLIEKIQFDALGEIITGVLIYIYGLKGLKIKFSLRLLFVTLLFIIIACIVFTTLKTISAALAFKMKNSFFILKAVYSLNDFTRYPINIYPDFLKFILTYVFSFAVSSYYPMEILLLENATIKNYMIITIIPIILIILAKIVWNMGERAYESAGA